MLAGIASACSDDKEPQAVPAAPKVEFAIDGDALSVPVDSSVRFVANIIEGTDLSTGWWVDDVKIAETPSVTWTFSQIGTFVVRFEVSNTLGTVEKSYSVTVNGIPLEVEYSDTSESVSAVAGVALTLSVTIIGGDKSVQHLWTLDGESVSETAEFSYVFSEAQAGMHTVTYYGVNSDGMSASRTWTVSVSDLPLEMSFTPSEVDVSAMVGDVVEFSATALHGSKGLSCRWMLDGTEVSSGTSYSYDCTAAGTFTVDFAASNDAGESVSRSWTLYVTERVEQTMMFLDAEELSAVPSFVTANNVGGVSVVQIVANPHVTAANPGTRVFIDDLRPTTWANSGYVQFMISGVPGAELAKYTAVRVKVWIGTSEYVPHMTLVRSGNEFSLPTKVNGEDFYPGSSSQANWERLVRREDWNVLEYSVVTGNYPKAAATSLADVDQFQLRMTVSWSNGSASKDASATNLRYVYFDDVEFVE